MFANVMARTRKPLSVAMAALLAALLVPVVPGGSLQAMADEQATAYGDFITSDANSEGFMTKGIVNNYASTVPSFVQAVDANAIKSWATGANLVKPAVDPSDATLVAAAEAAASGAVAQSADTAAASDAQAKVDADSALEAASRADAATKASTLFNDQMADPSGKQKIIEAATAAAQSQHPGSAISNVEIALKAPSAPGDFDATATLGDPTLGVASATASNPTVTPGSATFVLGDDSWSLDESSFSVDVSQVKSTDESIVVVTPEGANGFKVDAQAAGSADISLPFTYDFKIKGGTGTFGFQYDLKYTPSYVFDDCTYAYGFTYSYDDAGATKNGSGSVSGFAIDEKPSGSLTTANVAGVAKADEPLTFSADYTPTDPGFTGESSYSYTFETSNLFSDAFVESAAATPLTGADALQYGGADKSTANAKDIAVFDAADFANPTAAWQLMGDPDITTTNGFSASYDKATGLVKVTPRNATDPAGESVTLTWSHNLKTPITRTVTAAVDQLEITYDMAVQPFRLEAEQQKRVLDDANAQLNAAIARACGDDMGAKGYYSAVAFTGYDGRGAGQSPALVFKNSSDAAAYANFKVVDASSVTVSAMKDVSWKDSGLKLAATNGTSAVTLDADNANGTWINSKPSAAWDGAKLAYATKGVPAEAGAFGSSADLSGGDGIHTVEMYAMDEDGVVSQVTGITYMLDTQSPVLLSAEASSPYRTQTFGGMLFGDSQIDVQFALGDEAKQNQAESKDSLQSLASGVDNAKTKAFYSDAEGGQTDIAAHLSNDKGSLYSFAIAGSKDVPTSSIRVESVDNAGNVMSTTADNSRDIPMEYLRLVTDASAPEISVAWDTYDARNGRYYQTNRTMTVTISDEYFNYVIDYCNDQTITVVRQNGQPAIVVHPSDFVEVSTNVWQYTLAFTADADWDVADFAVSDIVGGAGHVASASGDSFTIDKTNPTLDVAFDNNNAMSGTYYNAARTATLTVIEHNFSDGSVNITPSAQAGNGDTVGQPSISGWASDGDVHTATVTFPGEGVYSMTVDGMDLAENAMPSHSVDEFVVDTVKPEIEIMFNGASVGDGEGVRANAGDASVQVVVHDTNVDTATAINVEAGTFNTKNPYEDAATRSETATDVTVDFGNPENIWQNDGVYSLNITSTDKAGNIDTKSYSWSVNRFGSTYELTGTTSNMMGAYLTSKKLGDVTVREYNPSTLSSYDVELAKGSNVSTLAKGSQYKVEEAQDGGWSTYDYTVLKSNYEEDGSYHVLFHSEDAANQKSDNTAAKSSKDRTEPVEVSFGVDNTAPTCEFLNLDADQYDETEHTSQVQINDNTVLDSAEIKVVDDEGKGATLFEKKLSGKELSGNAVQEIKLQESKSKQLVQVSARDAAGNEHSAERSVLVTTDFFAQVQHNTTMLAGLMAGGAVVLVLAGVGIGFGVRRHKAGAADAGRKA